VKKNLVFFLVLTTCLFISILFFIQELKKDVPDFLGISIIFLTSFVGFSVGLFIKKYNFLDFLKVLLPATVSIITSVWLFSSGYLNLQRAIIQNEIIEFKEEKKMVFEELEILKDSLVDTQKQLESKNAQVDFLENEIVIFEKIMEETKKETSEYRQLNREYLELTINTKNDFNNWPPKLILNSIDLGTRPINISLMVKDIDGEILTDQEIGVFCANLSAKCAIIFDQKEKKFFIKLNIEDEQQIRTGILNIRIAKVANLNEDGYTFRNADDLYLPLAKADYSLTLKNFYSKSFKIK